MFKDYLCHIANTIFRLYQHPFDEEWDRLLNEILDHGDCLSVGKYTATFWFNSNTYEVWINNRWYACAELYRINEACVFSNQQFRPRFRTMRRLHRFASEFHRGTE